MILKKLSGVVFITLFFMPQRGKILKTIDEVHGEKRKGNMILARFLTKNHDKIPTTNFKKSSMQLFTS
ncbi:MAG TPA: hypothetical protein PLY70_07540 [Saprospiraceae bacterium]|nr:hypothetical protein [Saprospiraceae bacterium]HPN69542.1 hypothetical protein [Saprospiraceae bacterium]